MSMEMPMEIPKEQKNMFAEEYRRLLERHKKISEKSAPPIPRISFQRIAELQAMLDTETMEKIKKETENDGVEKKEA